MEEEGGGRGAEAVESDVDTAETWLTTGACFSSGRPLRSKKESAAEATSAAVMVSTSFPNISRMRGGSVLRRCSLLT